ncbi:MAG: thioredoxin family protein [Rhodobacteraceae bacterium]|nr:thioredoxin family protein [Paracoccaceae bacterium]
MDRRHFLALAPAAALLPLTAEAADKWTDAGCGATPHTGISYTPGLIDAELAAGKTVFVEFGTCWCSTCASQVRSIRSLQAENPAYQQAISFVSVNWDKYSNDPMTVMLDIPRRSTLVALKGDEELGRIVADTSRGRIKGLMDVALAAATAA